MLEELATTRRMLELLLGGTVEERRPHAAALLERRADRLRLLHAQQVRLLRGWREAQTDNSPEAGALLIDLLVTVHAIASGLGTTG